MYDELVAAIKGTPARPADAEVVHPAHSAPVASRDVELGDQATPFSTALSHPPVSREPGSGSRSVASAREKHIAEEDVPTMLVPSLLGVQVACRPRISSTPLPASSKESMGPRMDEEPEGDDGKPLKATSLRVGRGDPLATVPDLQEPDWLKLARRVSRSNTSRRLMAVVDQGSEPPEAPPSETPPSPFMMTSL